MLLDVQFSYNARIITPIKVQDRQYYVLFRRSQIKGPFSVQNSALQVPNTLVHIADLKPIHQDEVVGNLFFSGANTMCNGGMLLAYSGLFKTSVNFRTPTDFSVDLVVNTPDLQVFSQRNKATMVVSPSMKRKIRENLEV